MYNIKTNNKILKAALYFVGSVFLLTLIFKGGIGTTNHLLYFLACSVIILILTFSLKKKNWLATYPFVEHLFLLIFLILISDAYLLREIESVGLIETYSIYAGAVMLFAGYSLTKKHIGTLYNYVTLFTLTSSVIGFYLFFTGPFERFAGSFNNIAEPYSAFPNAYGSFALISLPIIFYSLSSLKKKKSFNITTYIPHTALVLTVAGAYLTHSLGVYLVMILLYASLLIPLMRQWLKTLLIILLTILGLLVGVASDYIKPDVLYREPLAYSEVESQDVMSYENMSSVSKRVDHFKAGVNLALNGRLFGYGPGSYAYVSKPEVSFLNTATHPHNIFLKYAVEFGIIPTLFFILFLVTTLTRSFMLLLRKLDPERKVAFMGVTVLLLHHMIDYNLDFVIVESLMFLLLGIATVKNNGKKHVEPAYSNITMLFAGIVFAILTITPLYEIGVRTYVKASHNIGGARYSKLYINKYVDLAKEARFNGEPESFIESITLSGLQENPYDAELYALQGDYYKAYQLDPHNLLYLLGLYETSTPKQQRELLPTINQTLDQYIPLLESNTHFTVITQNPLAAYSLAKSIDADEKAAIIMSLYQKELSKFNTLYSINETNSDSNIESR